MYVIPDSVNTVEEAKEVMKEIDEVLGKWWIEGKGVDLFGEWGCSVLNGLFSYSLVLVSSSMTRKEYSERDGIQEVIC